MSREDFYARLRRHYDVLFPLDPARAEFLLSLTRGRRAFLDLGCATGSLCAALCAEFEAVEGWDLDEGLLADGREKSATLGNLVLERRDLREAGQSRLRPDLVTCLGNTLPHLGSPEEVLAVLRGMRRLVRGEGAAVVQTVNWDALGTQADFPPLVRGELSFHRAYRPRPDGRVDFTARLDGPEGSSEATVALLPLPAATLEGLAREAGFSQVRLRGGFARRPWGPGSPATVAVLRR